MSRRTRLPGSPSPSSTRRLGALVTQFARTRPESSTRSSAGPYQVRRGWLGSSPVRRSSTLVAMLMGTSVVGPGAGAGVGALAPVLRALRAAVLSPAWGGELVTCVTRGGWRRLEPPPATRRKGAGEAQSGDSE